MRTHLQSGQSVRLTKTDMTKTNSLTLKNAAIYLHSCRINVFILLVFLRLPFPNFTPQNPETQKTFSSLSRCEIVINLF